MAAEGLPITPNQSDSPKGEKNKTKNDGVSVQLAPDFNSNDRGWRQDWGLVCFKW